MRILFAALHPGYYRNFDSVIEELARRGHEVHLGFERPDSTNAGETLVERLMARWPGLTCGRIPSREPDAAGLLAKTRLGLDYLRYLDPIYPPTSFLPVRAKRRAPTGIVRLTESPLLRSHSARRAIAYVLDAIDRAVPTSPAIDRFLEDWRPDLVAITPLLGLGGSSQLDLLRGAQGRRIRTAVLVYSWDHLTSKALIRDVPDGLFVWNQAQQQEAVDMHRVPSDRIVVTGAQCFDHWFGRGPSRSRTEWVRHAGLPDDRPYLLWVCSTLLQGGPSEPELAMRWLRHLRGSANPQIRDAAVLIRPHPSRMSDWDGVDWRGLGNVALFGHTPVDTASRSDYFDSLYYSAAVVGITTTAFVDAAVVGRPVMTIFFDDVRHEHQGSLHFQHLLKFAGGLVTVARSLEEHERQLAAMIDGPPEDVMEQQRRFVHAFVRPHGLDVSATTIMADALERVGTSATTTVAQTASLLGLFGIRGLKIMAGQRRWQHLLLSERESAYAAEIQAKRRLQRERKNLAYEDAGRAERRGSS
jgi:hypothetical protein